MIDLSRVAVFSHHHRRSLFFETGIERLYNAGLNNIYIQETGLCKWGTYVGPIREWTDLGHQSFDTAMVCMRNRVRALRNIDYILLVDNDCFIRDPQHTLDYLEQSINGEYDFVSHPPFSLGRYTEQFSSTQEIIPVTDQQFQHCDVYPGFSPDPHYENSYTVISKRVFTSLTEMCFSHTRLLIQGIHQAGLKIGMHKCCYCGNNYSHYGPGWFHVGYLMDYYYALETGNKARFNLSSKFDMSRLGYFIAQSNAFADCNYPTTVQGTLAQFTDEEKEYALQCWRQLTENTIMGNYL